MKNIVDLINIRKIINDRTREKPTFLKGGNFSISSLEELSTNSLRDFEEVHIKYFNNIIKRKVDEIFNIFGKEGDNCIIISAANYYDDSRHISEDEEVMNDINFDNHDNNKLYYVVNGHWPKWRYNRQLTDEEKAKWNNYYDNYLDPLYDLVTTVYFSAAEYYEDDNDALNSCWYGVVAITKDYKLITFVIRNDGLLCDEDSMNERYNKIICEL